MTRTEAHALAAHHDVAVYRNDTIARLLVRVNTAIEVAAQIAERQASERAPILFFAVRRYYARPVVQLSLPMAMPADFSNVCGMVMV